MKMIKKDEGFRSTPTNGGIGTHDVGDDQTTDFLGIGTHDGEFTGFI